MSTRTALLILAVLLVVVGCGRASSVGLSGKEVVVTQEWPGNGAEARPGDEVCIDYRVRKDDEELMWGKDFRFLLGRGATIAGIDEGVTGMREGGRRIVRVPPHKHWGRPGYGKGENAIPPKAMLDIEIKLVSVN